MAHDSESERRDREAREETLAQAARKLAPSLIGMSRSAADHLVAEAELSIRYHRSGEYVTEEFVSGRITACTDDEKTIVSDWAG
jgi:D-serine deaminase-like pyridoxal phosphate-dependent protein